MGHSTTIHFCYNAIFAISLDGCKALRVDGTTFAGISANGEYEIQTNYILIKKEVKTMIIGYLMEISFFLTFILWLLHKYAARRAKYLVNLELSSPTGHLVENETMIEVTPILKPTKPFGVNLNGRVATNKVLYHN